VFTIAVFGIQAELQQRFVGREVCLLLDLLHQRCFRTLNFHPGKGNTSRFAQYRLNNHANWSGKLNVVIDDLFDFVEKKRTLENKFVELKLKIPAFQVAIV
jgi:hypothetical protein